MEYGINSVDELSKLGRENSTGEQLSRIEGKRSFISFTDNLDTTIGYSSISSKQANSFSMLICMSTDDISKCSVSSDMPEIGIMNHVPIEYIKAIAVPENKISFVHKIVGDKPIAVVPIDMKENSITSITLFLNLILIMKKQKNLCIKKIKLKSFF